MIGNGAATAADPASDQGLVDAAASLAGKGGYGTLVLDGQGRIRSCGTAAGQMLGSSFSELAGKPISAFLANFSVGASSLSYGARYFAHLCAEGGWRKFDAVDAHGREFPVELSLSKVRTDGKDYFLLNLRRPAIA